MGNTPSAPPPAPSTAPYNAQLNQVHLQLSCSQVNGSNVTLSSVNATVSATAPLIAGGANFSDIAASLILPYTNDTVLSANVSLSLTITNSTPSTCVLERNVNVSDNTISLPGLEQSAAPITLGPVALQGIARYSIGTVDYTLLHQSGNSSSYVCDVPQNIIGTIVSDNTTNLQAPANGAPAAFPSADPGSKATVANLPLGCVVDNGTALRSVPFNMSVTSVSPITSTRAFDVPEWVIILTIPASEVNNILNITNANDNQIGILASNAPTPGIVLGYDFSNASVSRFDSHDGWLAFSNAVIANFTQAYYKTFNGSLTMSFSNEGGFTGGAFAAGDGRDNKASLELNALLKGGGHAEDFACISLPL